MDTKKIYASDNEIKVIRSLSKEIVDVEKTKNDDNKFEKYYLESLYKELIHYLEHKYKIEIKSIKIVIGKLYDQDFIRVITKDSQVLEIYL